MTNFTARRRNIRKTHLGIPGSNFLFNIFLFIFWVYSNQHKRPAGPIATQWPAQTSLKLFPTRMKDVSNVSFHMWILYSPNCIHYQLRRSGNQPYWEIELCKQERYPVNMFGRCFGSIWKVFWNVFTWKCSVRTDFNTPPPR